MTEAGLAKNKKVFLVLPETKLGRLLQCSDDSSPYLFIIYNKKIFLL
jgi:hypothetical protein